MSQPFHLSFIVPDLEAVKVFYVSLLGCSIGRDNGKWVDILFFGNQLTIHQQCNDNLAVTIDHFGVILSRYEWKTVLGLCIVGKIEFRMLPKLSDRGEQSESGKFMIKDPAGNILEFKYYVGSGTTVGAQDA